MAKANHLKKHQCSSCNPERRKLVAETAVLQDLSGGIFFIYHVVLDEGVAGSVVDYFIDRRKGGE